MLSYVVAGAVLPLLYPHALVPHALPSSFTVSSTILDKIQQDDDDDAGCCATE